MILKLTKTDSQAILNVINDAAILHKDKIPIDCWKVPYMSEQELKEEIQNDIQFYGLIENNILVAVMGIQPVKNVTLIRHAYVLKIFQRKGHGKKLLNFLLSLVKTSEVYVGTWKAAVWATEFYQKNGFELVSTKDKNKLLKAYWRIPDRQVETSIVLELKRLTQ